MEKMIAEKNHIPYCSIPAAGLHGVGLLRLPSNLTQLYKGWKKAKEIIQSFTPDVIFFTGGYLAGPVALAGRGIPKVAFVPDIEPGLALRFLNRMIDHIAVTTTQSVPFLPKRKKATVTGYPLRKEILQWNKTAARKKMGLHSKKPVVTIIGGSSGARSINRAVFTHLDQLIEQVQIVHICGNMHWQETQSIINKLSPHSKQDYHAFPFLDEEMGAALAAADLVVSRSGASILGELPYFGVPAILVPYPHAWRYQKTNAAYLVARGGAILLEDALLERDIVTTISQILSQPNLLKEMGAKMRTLAQPEAAAKISEIIARTAKMKEGEKTSW